MSDYLTPRQRELLSSFGLTEPQKREVWAVMTDAWWARVLRRLRINPAHFRRLHSEGTPDRMTS